MEMVNQKKLQIHANKVMEKEPIKPEKKNALTPHIVINQNSFIKQFQNCKHGQFFLVLILP